MPPSSDHGFELVDDADLRDYNDAGLLPLDDSDLKKICKWLQLTAYSDDTSEYFRHLSSHTQGTGDWIPDTEEYKQWHVSSQHNVIWIKAVPGAGKSVLAAHRLAQISATEKCPVLYFFFRQIVITNRTPLQLVRDWIAQLIPASPFLQHRLKADFLDSLKPLEAVTLSDLWRVFHDAVSQMPRVYCFADALDEMSSGNEEFIHRLVHLGETTPCKVFLTSRPIPSIVENLRGKPVLQISLGPENMMEDISKYVDHRIEHDIVQYINHRLRTSAVQLGPADERNAIEQLVRDTLRTRSQGSFLYAKLIMDNFLETMHGVREDMSKEMARQALNSLPAGLTEMYSNMLRDHSQKIGISQTLQLDILKWVTHSERPLRLLELATILDLQDGVVLQDRNTKTILRQACGPLLEIMPSDVIGPVHHSFTEFLLRPADAKGAFDSQFPTINFRSAHHQIASKCLLYIEYVSNKPGAEDQEFEQLKLTYPFIDYAVHNWASHVAKCGDATPPELVALLDRCLADNAVAQKLCLKSVISSQITRHETSVDPRYRCHADDGMHLTYESMSVLHIAAAFNLKDYVNHLAGLGYDIDAEDSDGNKPLHYAAQRGSKDSAVALLHLGAHPESSNGSGYSPMHLAAVKNRPAMIDLLVNHGADPKTQRLKIDQASEHYVGSWVHSNPTLTPLHCAVRGNNRDAFGAIVKRLAAADLGLAFEIATSRRCPQLAEQVARDSRFAVDQPIGAQGETPLNTAAKLGYVDCMAALLENGASARATSSTGETALLCFVRSHSRVSDTERVAGVEMLLSAGCPIDALDDSKRTALTWAAHTDAVITSSLLSHGADPQAVIKFGSHPLHENLGQRMDVMKTWIAYGLDINSKDTTGYTPLMRLFQKFKHQGSASRSIQGEKIYLTRSVANLLELGADPNIPLDSGVSPLHLACALQRSETAEVIEALIQAGADVNARDEEGRTPLMNVEPGYLASLGPILLKAGADVDAVDQMGRNAGFGHIRREHVSPTSISQLSASVIDAKTRDSCGVSVLHRICFTGSLASYLQKYLSSGADPSTEDHWGNTALHYAAISDRGGAGPSMIKILVKLGIDPRKTNYQGQSPLHLAASSASSHDLSALLSFCQLDINKPDVRGFVPLQLAAASSLRHVLRLLHAGADPAYRTRRGETALHFAAVARDTNILSALLSRLGNPSPDLINSKDRNGRTALHYAARSGVGENVKILLEHGADPCSKDGNGLLPLDACCEFPEESRSWFDDSDVLIISHLSSDAHRLPHLLRRGWPEIAQELRKQTRNEAQSQSPSVRMCARYLIAAGKASVGPSKSMTSHLNKALAARCEPLADELMLTIKELEKQGITAEVNEKPPSLGSFNLGPHSESPEARALNNRIGEAIVRTVRAELTEIVKGCDEGDHEAVADLLVQRDFDVLFKNLNVGDEVLQTSVSSAGRRRHSSLLEYLASKGRYEALRDLALRSGSLRSSYRDQLESTLPKGLYKPSFGTLHFVSKEFLAATLDGLLLRACQRPARNMEVVKTIVEKIGCSDLEKTLAVMEMSRAFVLEYWRIDAIKYLVGHGADVNAVNKSRQTALLLACSNQNGDDLQLEFVRCLLELGADPNILGSRNQSCLNAVYEPLHRHPKPAVGLLLLDYGADPEAGGTHLMRTAIEMQDIGLVRRLVKSGCDLNQTFPWADTDDFGMSEAKEQVMVVSCVIYAAIQPIKGSRIEMKRSDESDLAQFIADNERTHDEIIQILLDAGAKPFTSAAGNGGFGQHFLLSRDWRVGPILEHPDLDLESKDQEGRTMLLCAASNCQQTDYPLRLLQRGCDIEAVDSKGRNLFHHLVRPPGTRRLRNHNRRPCKDILEVASKRPGFDRLVNAPDSTGRSPMHYLMIHRDVVFAMLMHQYGARLDIPDPQKNTAMHHWLPVWVDPLYGFSAYSSYDADFADYLRLFKTVRGKYSLVAPHDQAMMKNKPRNEGNTGQEEERKEEEEEEEEISFPQWLCSKGIDINQLNNAGEPAIFGVLRVCPTVGRCLTSGPEAGLTRPEQSIDSMKSGVVEPDQYVERLQLMIDAGADVHVKGRGGVNALHVLATKPPERHSAPEDGLHPLELRVQKVWKLLVDAGLDPWAEDDECRSALDIAAASGNTLILSMY